MTSAGIDLRMQAWRKSAAAAGKASLWMEEALAAEGTAPPDVLHGAIDADVCIVGGGFTGLWTALRLLERAPGTKIVIVEAGLCGSGASGRNSGAMGHWWPRLPTLVRLLGRDDGLHLLRASVDILQDIRGYIEANAIDCDMRLESSVWSTSFAGQPGGWKPMFQAAKQLGVEPPHRELTRDQLKDLYGDAPYYTGVTEDNVIRLQPAALARGLRKLALERGVRVCEASPVERIASEANHVTVTTTQGSVRAHKVLLAANAWMAHLPEFKPYIAVVSSEIVATDPIPDLLDKLGARHRPGGVNSRMMLNYGGITRQGRVYLGRGGGTIAWGNRVGPEFDHNPAMSAEVEQDFRWLYPELRDVPIARSWAGPIDRSTTGLPWFGQFALDPRVHYAIGYSGHGVGAAALGGQVLASQITGRQDDWSALGDLFLRARSGWWPPEPVRYAAARVIRGAVARRENAQRAGRTPSRLDTRLAMLSMSSLPDRRRRD
ncbi:MAG: FAD-dependent oxidoreductase [Comamonadaceae bacterium]|nr:MAG: FAD-dependent oxidoreductase [Comamonadaceae bacterium]